jgi:endonuclease/exonuclease/phosphatase (EEP) superfamily protein YafD
MNFLRGLRPKRCSLGKVFEVILVFALLLTWVGYLGSFHWFLALFDHFRLQGVIVCSVVLILFVIRRRWKWVVFALLSLGASFWPIWKTSGTLLSNVQSDGVPGLKIISFNVLRSNTLYQETEAYLKAADADVILLMEVNSDWKNALASLRQSHPYGTATVQEDHSGNAIYSRVPLVDFQVDGFVAGGMPCITAVVKHGDRVVRLIGVHPLPPWGRNELAVQLAQFEAVARQVSATPEIPALVLGDFNAAPWSQAISLLREKTILDFRTPKPVWRPTWQRTGLLALPIDHALCTQQLFFERREIGPELGSDHRPQELLLRWVK